MSVTKNMKLEYLPDPVDIKFKLQTLKLQNLDDLEHLTVYGMLHGYIGDATNSGKQLQAHANYEQLIAGMTATEKTAAKKFIAAVERILVNNTIELQDTPHISTDVFVAPIA